jgi:hypothetical protein
VLLAGVDLGFSFDFGAMDLSRKRERESEEASLDGRKKRRERYWGRNTLKYLSIVCVCN